MGPEKKALWLLIAQNAAAAEEGGDSVAKVISVLRESGEGVLSIEDVLPFLPDFSTIDTFKNEIVAALTVYSEKINNYKDSMAECDLACDDYREEIEILKKKKVRGSEERSDELATPSLVTKIARSRTEVQPPPSITSAIILTNHSNPFRDSLRSSQVEVEPNFKCAISGKDILVGGSPVDVSDHYYSFPSGFKVYDSELRRVVISVLDDEEKKELEELMEEITSVEKTAKEEEGLGGIGGLGKGGFVEGVLTENQLKLEALKKTYDGIVAKECPLTGDIMINSIESPIEGWDDDLSKVQG